MTRWWVIIGLTSLGQMALGVALLLYSAGSLEMVLGGLVFFVPGALTCVGLFVRWLTIFAIAANVLLAGLSAIWIPACIDGVLFATNERGYWTLSLARFVVFAAAAVLSIIAIIKLDRLGPEWLFGKPSLGKENEYELTQQPHE